MNRTQDNTQLLGTCSYCDAVITKVAANSHLKSCIIRSASNEAANASRGPRETFFHLRVEDMSRAEYWLDLEMRGISPLVRLDDYLREIWLECCGHLSGFSMGLWS